MKSRTTRKTTARSLPPYSALAAKLRRLVADGGMAPGDWIGTEVQLATDNGISRMTARRAVQELVDEGLVERRAGRGVFVREKVSSGRMIAFLAGNLLWAPAVRVAHAVQEEAASNGFVVEVFDARGNLAAFLEKLSALPQSGAVGAIVMSQHDSAFNRSLAELVAADFPFVVVDQALADIPGASVASDNRTGGRIVAEALLEAGHRSIAFLGDMAADTTAARAQGVSDACAAALVQQPAIYNIPGQRFDDWEPAILNNISKILSDKERPTALVCSCDAVARTAMRALAAHGVSLPLEMSITGFDDDPIAEWTTPALTTVRQDFDEMGHRAFAALTSILGGAKAGHEAVPVTLVRRGSVTDLGKRVMARDKRLVS